MDLQLMDYRNSSKCASASPPLCFPNAAPSGVTCHSVDGACFMKVVRVPEVAATSRSRSTLLARCTAPPPLMTTSTRTPLCIRPSSLLEICWPAASSVSKTELNLAEDWEKSASWLQGL